MRRRRWGQRWIPFLGALQANRLSINIQVGFFGFARGAYRHTTATGESGYFKDARIPTGVAGKIVQILHILRMGKILEFVPSERLPWLRKGYRIVLPGSTNVPRVRPNERGRT